MFPINKPQESSREQPPWAWMLESDGGAGAADVFWLPLLLPLLPLGRYRSEGSDRAECSQEPGSGQEREVESEGWEVGRTHRGAANQNKKSREQKEEREWAGAKTSGQVELEEMSSLVKEDLEKKLFKPLSQNLYEFIEIEFSVQDRYYLCVSGNLFFLLSFQNVNNPERLRW